MYIRVILGAMAAMMVARCAGPPDKPVRESIMNVDGRAAPADMSELLNAVSAVFVGRFTGNGRLVDRSPIMTAYSFDVQEVIKYDPALPAVGGTVDVRLFGGDVDHSTYIERKHVDGTNPLVPDQRYVVFLNRGYPGGPLLPAFAHGGVYEIKGDVIEPLGASGSFHRNTPAETFLTLLRARSRG